MAEHHLPGFDKLTDDISDWAAKFKKNLRRLELRWIATCDQYEAANRDEEDDIYREEDDH